MECSPPRNAHRLTGFQAGSHRLPHPRHHRARPPHVGFQRGRSVDSDFRYIQSEFRVVIFKAIGGADDGLGPVPGAHVERGGAVVRDWNQHQPGRGQVRLFRREGEEVRIDQGYARRGYAGRIRHAVAPAPRPPERSAGAGLQPSLDVHPTTRAPGPATRFSRPAGRTARLRQPRPVRGQRPGMKNRSMLT